MSGRLIDELANAYAMIDSTVVPAHQHSADAKEGASETDALVRSKEGLTTTIHATCDALGNPTGFYLSHVRTGF